MTGYASKKAAANAKLEQAKEILLQHPQKDIDWQREQQIKAHAKLDDDDIQVYQKPWVDLTDESITQVIDLMPNGINGWMSDWDLYEFARAVLAKSKEKNSLQ